MRVRVIQAVDETHVEVHEGGLIEISQNARGEESSIWVPVDRIAELCRSLLAAAKEAQQKLDE